MPEIPVTVLKFKVAGRDFELPMLLDKDDPSDRDTMNAFADGLVYQTDVTQLIVRAVRPGDRVIDAGANIGFYTLLMAHLAGPYGEVFAFEPNPYNCNKLNANVALNRLTNVRVCQAPLWAAHTKKSFYACGHNAWGSVHDVPQFGNVPTTKIDGLDTSMLDDVLPPIRLIKLDIEGAELAALCGAERHIKNHLCPFVISELNGPMMQQLHIDQHVMYGLMRAHGYEVFLLHFDKPPQLVPRGTHIRSNDDAGKPSEPIDDRILNVVFSTKEDISGLRC